MENAVNGKQLDSVREETPEVSVMIEHLEKDAIRDKKDNRPLLHQKQRHRLTERKLQKVQVSERKVLLEQETKFRADISVGESVRARHVFVGTLPCVSIIKSESGCTCGEKSWSDTWRLMGSPAESSRKVL